MDYPVRINKYLAQNKLCSRREADELIRQGKVSINGKKAKLGDKVLERDKITLSQKLKEVFYYAFNKPKGLVTHNPQINEKCILDTTKFPQKVFPPTDERPEDF